MYARSGGSGVSSVKSWRIEFPGAVQTAGMPDYRTDPAEPPRDEIDRILDRAAARLLRERLEADARARPLERVTEPRRRRSHLDRGVRGA